MGGSNTHAKNFIATSKNARAKENQLMVVEKNKKANEPQDKNAVDAASKIPVIPGLVREPFPLSNGEIGYSYHLKFQRGDNEEFKLDLHTPGKFLGKADGSSYKSLDDLELDWGGYVEVHPVYINNFDSIILPTTDKEKVECKMGVEIKSIKNVAGVDVETSALLITKRLEHQVALREYFKAKAIIAKMKIEADHKKFKPKNI